MPFYCLITIIVVLILFLSFGLFFRLFKGKIGEKMVASLLKTLPEDQYVVLNDILLETSNGSTQIDHVVVSIYGVFVIETKYYRGWITGGENSEYWTKNVYGNKYSFRNPILQNAGHVRALQKAVPSLKEIPVIPIVVFLRQALLRTNTASIVIYRNQLLNTIRSYDSECIKPIEMREIARDIHSLNIVQDNARQKHKAYAKSSAKQNIQKINSGICPRCGGQLVLRQGRYGRFYGCSNYPTCKFSQNL